MRWLILGKIFLLLLLGPKLGLLYDGVANSWQNISTTVAVTKTVAFV
jgi:hypothetical protein